MQQGFTTIHPEIEAAKVEPALRVTEWMSKRLITTRPDTPLADVLDKMTDHRIRHVPVIDGDRLLGIISDRDVRNALSRTRRHRAPLARPASEVMTKHPITIPMDFSIHEASEIMCREKIGALPVMDGGRMIGIISTEDLLWALMQMTGETSRVDT